MAAHHRAFIAPRLVGGLSALAALPVFLAARGVPSTLEFIVLVWMVVPIATACYLSRTGRYESAHVVSALSLTGIASAVAAYSGGIDSIAALWLVLILLEAMVSGSRRVAAVAVMLALGGAVLLMLVVPAAPAIARQADALTALAVLSVLFYATGLALGAQRIARANSRPLVAQEERWRLLAGNMTDVVTRHGDGGRVLFASTNAYAVLGIAAGELQGLGLFDRIHIADRPAFLTTLSDASTRGLARSVEFRLRQPKLGDEQGRFAWIEMQCKPLDLPGPGDGNVAGREVVAIMRDVSKQKTLEQDLADARAEAERSNAAKSRFLAIMSHELRTPLNAVIGFSEMLANAEHLRIDHERRQEYARLIRDSGGHLLEVVNDVLDASRLETGDFKIVPEPFEPAAVIEGCREMLAPKARELGVALQLRVPQRLPDIVADKRALKQILINLVANGLEFTNRGGTVTIDAAVERECLAVSVEDTGIGIAPEHVGRLGDAFFQVRSSYARTHNGAGLGLSIVKGLVKLHGGEVVVRSRVGEGTRVMVRLPLDCERQRAPEPIRKFVPSADAEYPHTSSLTTATAPRFKPAVKKSA